MLKIHAQNAHEIAKNYDIDSKSRALLKNEHKPEEFLAALMHSELHQEAIQFLAHGLPAREAVWWACVCSGYHLGDNNQKYQTAHNAAKAWVYTPTEENRRIAGEFSTQSEYSSPASWAATAAFWSGGSITKQGEPVMIPPPYLYAHAVSGSVVMCVGWQKPGEKEVKRRFDAYLRHGINIANGGTE